MCSGNTVQKSTLRTELTFRRISQETSCSTTTRGSRTKRGCDLLPSHSLSPLRGRPAMLQDVPGPHCWALAIRSLLARLWSCSKGRRKNSNHIPKALVPAAFLPEVSWLGVMLCHHPGAIGHCSVGLRSVVRGILHAGAALKVTPALLPSPSSLSIIVQRSGASQCTPLKVTHQYAFKGFDLCWMKYQTDCTVAALQTEAPNASPCSSDAGSGGRAAFLQTLPRNGHSSCSGKGLGTGKWSFWYQKWCDQEDRRELFPLPCKGTASERQKKNNR
ncbi:uncharacterized protein LOC110387432 [Numida meleagris]|uniref:uncharacterized protein LOC110387432 n=1 Tax=Numida meleagris TaxID=8996 RepID=UPI000B3DCAA0|nr:uncharacterized protein LOC110387432 [Numida meleagris]